MADSRNNNVNRRTGQSRNQRRNENTGDSRRNNVDRRTGQSRQQRQQSKTTPATKKKLEQVKQKTITQAIKKGTVHKDSNAGKVSAARQQEINALQTKLSNTKDRRERAGIKNDIATKQYGLSYTDRQNLTKQEQQEVRSYRQAWDEAQRHKDAIDGYVTNGYMSERDAETAKRRYDDIQRYYHGAAEMTRAQHGYTGGAGGDSEVRFGRGRLDKNTYNNADTNARLQQAYATKVAAQEMGDQELIDGANAGLDTVREFDKKRNLIQRAGYAFTGAVGQSQGSYAELLASFLDNNGNVNRSSRYAREGMDDLASSQADATQAAADKLYASADRLAQQSGEAIDIAKNGANPFTKLGIDVGIAGTQMLGDMAVNAIAPGAGSAALFSRSFGGAHQTARQDGASDAGAMAYGLGVGAVELATGKLFQASMPMRQAYGAALSRGGKSLDDIFGGVFEKAIKNPVIAKWAWSSTSEGLEEVMSGVADPILRGLTYGEFGSPSVEGLQSILYDGLVGAALGGLAGGADVVGTRNAGQALLSMDVDGSRTEQLIEAGMQKPRGTAGYRAAVMAQNAIDSGRALTPAEAGLLITENATMAEVVAPEAISTAVMQNEQEPAPTAEQTAPAEPAPVRKLVQPEGRSANLRSLIAQSGGILETSPAKAATANENVVAELEAELGTKAPTEKNAKVKWIQNAVAELYEAGMTEQAPVEEDVLQTQAVEPETAPITAQDLANRVQETPDTGSVDIRSMARQAEPQEDVMTTQAVEEPAKTATVKENTVSEPVSAKPATAVEAVSRTVGESGAKAMKATQGRTEDVTHASNFAKVYNSAMKNQEAEKPASMNDTQYQAARFAAENDRGTLMRNVGKTGSGIISSMIDDGATHNEVNSWKEVYNAAIRGDADIPPSEYLTEEQISEAWDAGVADNSRYNEYRLKETATATKAKNAGVVRATFKDSGLSDGMIRNVDKLAKGIGCTVELVDTLNGSNATVQGNRILIAKDRMGRNPIDYLLGHEATHRMQRLAPKEYSKLKDYFLTTADAEKRINREIRATKGMEYSEAVDEAVATWAGEVIHHQKELANMAQNADRTMLQRFVDFLKDMISHLTGRDKADCQNAIRLLEKGFRTSGDITKKLYYGDPTIEEESRHSITSLSRMAGLEARRVDGMIQFFDDEGNRVENVTADLLKDSGLGLLVNIAVEEGNITADEATKQLEAAAELYNLILQTQDSEMVWRFAGSAIFSAVKTNSDGQYGTTVDFSTVCKKTVEMITAMSDSMKQLGRGLTKDEVTELQSDILSQDGIVPCPVCYVFSRWAGIGGILDNIKKWQKQYVDMPIDEIRERHRKLKAAVKKKADLRTLLREEDIEYDMLASEKEEIDAEIKILNKNVKEAKKNKQPEAVRTLERKIANQKARKKEIADRMKDIENSGSPEVAWLERVRLSKDYDGEMVPDDVLFDLAEAGEFAEKYPLNWAYRTSRGPSAGKAILPYSDMRLGDLILGPKNNSASGKTLFANATGTPNSDQRKAIKTAILRTRAQNLIGGQRFQSTSDFRYDYALDYLQVFWEAQALGSNMQTYTKVVEFADMVAAIGGDVNLSAMPLNAGHENGKLVFSSVTGIDIDAARDITKRYNSAQIILVGINDEHIRLALESEDITFVIPYHASGASINTFIRSLVENLNETFNEDYYFDYQPVQTDKEKPKKNLTANQVRNRELRSSLLKKTKSVKKRNPETGKTSSSAKAWVPTDADIRYMKKLAKTKTDITGRSFEELKTIEDRALDGDKEAVREYESWSADCLYNLYQKLWEDEYYNGVKLNSSQAASVMPHEYWDKNTTIDNAYLNGFIFRSYCYNLGLIPRFSTNATKKVTENGVEKTIPYGNLSVYPGYWKTLIDRAMYNVTGPDAGKYRDQDKINVTTFDLERLQPSYKDKSSVLKNFNQKLMREPDEERAHAAANKFVERRRNSSVDMDQRASDSNNINGNEIVVFDPNNIKSAELVTRDDAGNVIPLSERFNDNNEDIRYSSVDLDEKYPDIKDVDVTNNEEVDKAYFDALNAGDEKRASEIINKRADELKAQVFAATDTPTFTIRRGPAPKKTIKCYKVFTLDEQGRPTALFVNSSTPIPVGVFLDAKTAYTFGVKNYKGETLYYVPSNKNKSTQGGATGTSIKADRLEQKDLEYMIENGYTKFNEKTGKYTDITALSARPGWHAGELPFFPQGGMEIKGSNYPNVHRYNQAVFECELINDIDYTRYHITDKGGIQYHDRDENGKAFFPTDGTYRYATNPLANAQDLGAWYISGSLRVNRALTEEECNEILQKNEKPVQEWQAFQPKHHAELIAKSKTDDELLEYYIDKNLEKHPKWSREKAAEKYTRKKGVSAYLEAEYGDLGKNDDIEKTYGPLNLNALGYDPNRTDGGTKLLDTITYDDDGNIIPPSQRFNPNVEDPRYSSVDFEEDLDSMGNEPVLKSDIKNYTVTKGSMADPADVKKLVRKFAKAHNADVDTDQLTTMLEPVISQIADYDRNPRDIDLDQVNNVLHEVGLEIANNAQTDMSEMYNQYEGLRKYFKKAIKVPTSIKDQIPDFDDFRKRNFGRLSMRLVNGTESNMLDSEYHTLASEYPELFHGATSAEDQLYEIESVLNQIYDSKDSVTPTYATQETIEEAAWSIAVDMMTDLAKLHTKNPSTIINREMKKNKALKDEVEKLKIQLSSAYEDARKSFVDELNQKKRTASPAKVKQDIPVVAKNAIREISDMITASMDDYNKLLEQHGSFDPGETPAREVQVPKRTARNAHVSQTIRTILEAKVTREQDIETIEQLVASGEFSYEAISDKAAVAAAEAQIEEMGYHEAYDDWTDQVRAGKVNKYLTARGWALYNAAATAGDAKMAVNILSDIVQTQRSAAQALQATRILKKMDPSSQLYSVRKSINGMQEKLDEQYGLAGDKGRRGQKANEVVKEIETGREDLLKEIEKLNNRLDALKRMKRNNRGRNPDAENLIKEIHKIFQKKTKNPKWEPGDWIEHIASDLERAMYNRTQERESNPVEPIAKTILGDLMKFADQFTSKKKSGPKQTRTATDRIRDYFANKEEYNRAWQMAIKQFTDHYGNDAEVMDKVDDWLNSTLGYNALGTDEVMLKAITEAALNDDVKLNALVRRAELGDRTAVEQEIYTQLINNIGKAVNGNEQIISDAVDRWTEEKIRDANLNIDEALMRDIRSEISEAGTTISKAIRTGKTGKQKMANDIAKKLTKKYGISMLEADNVSNRIVEMFNSLMAEKSREALESRFKDRTKQVRSIQDRLEELGNLGAYTDPDFAQKASQAVLGSQYDLNLNPDLVDRFLSATSQDERDEIMSEIYADIGRRLPATFRDKFEAWRYMAMLSNVRTHVRNIVGNLGFVPAVVAKNAVGMALEAPLAMFGKTRTKALYSPELFKVAWKDFANARPEIMAGGKYNDRDNMNQEIQDARRIFKIKPLEMIRVGNGTMLDMEDAWFSQPHYANALASYCAANHITADMLRTGEGTTQDVIDRAKAYAIHEAQKATYRDTNDFSQFVSQLGRIRDPNSRSQRIGSMLVMGMLPFRKTPANIAVRAIEYSPAGLLGALTRGSVQLAKGEIEAWQLLDSIAAGLTGTGILAAGAWLAAAGHLLPQDDDDENKATMDKLMGKQNWALYFGGRTYTIDWLAPEAIPLFMGAEIVRLREDDNENKLQATLSAFNNLTEPLFEMSCLSSVNDALDSLSGFGEKPVNVTMTMLVQLGTSYLTQAIPTLLGQGERASQEDRMSNWSGEGLEVKIGNKTFSLPDVLPDDWKYIVAKNSARIPGIDINQVEYIDLWGRRESEPSKFTRIVNNFINPAYVKKIDNDVVNKAIMEIYEATGENGVIPNNKLSGKKITIDGEDIKLTKEQYQTYQVSQGQNAYQLVQAYLAMDQYKKDEPADRAETIKTLYSYADFLAKIKTLPDREEDIRAKAPKMIQQADEALNNGFRDIISYMTAVGVANAAKESSKELSYAPDSRKDLLVMQALNKTSLTDQQKKYIYGVTSVSESYQAYSPAKVNEELSKFNVYDGMSKENIDKVTNFANDYYKTNGLDSSDDANKKKKKAEVTAMINEIGGTNAEKRALWLKAGYGESTCPWK